jgi:hypothetical protein
MPVQVVRGYLAEHTVPARIDNILASADPVRTMKPSQIK